MNFKEEFDKDCNKITASDELINKTLMNAMLIKQYVIKKKVRITSCITTAHAAIITPQVIIQL